MTRCRSQREVLQDGKGKEDIKPRAQAGPGRVAGGQAYEVYAAKKTKRSAR
jgi:hypothetical protein